MKIKTKQQSKSLSGLIKPLRQKATLLSLNFWNLIMLKTIDTSLACQLIQLSSREVLDMDWILPNIIKKTKPMKTMSHDLPYYAASIILLL